MKGYWLLLCSSLLTTVAVTGWTLNGIPDLRNFWHGIYAKEQTSEPAVLVSATVPNCPEQPTCTPADVTKTLPVIMDCSKYIYCETDGTETLLTCSFSLHFKAIDGTCVDPAVSGCPKCAAANVSTTDVSSPESTTLPTGSTIPVCPIQPNCTQANEYDTLPVIEDCTKYLYCPPEGQFEIDCPPPEEYSPTMQICMDPAIAGCPKCTGATVPYCPEQPVCTPDVYYETIPSITNCTFYIYCEPDGSELPIPCPVGQHYSPTQKLCMEPELAGCPQCSGSTTPFCPQQPECTPDFYYTTIPYIANCSIYIYCEPDGTELQISCPEGEHYSHSQGICVNETLSDCEACLGSTLEYSSTTEATTGNTTSIGSTIPVCPPQENCTPELFTYTLPYISNCSLYYYCEIDGSELLLECPNLLHYSPQIETCVPPSQSGCPKCP